MKNQRFTFTAGVGPSKETFTVDDRYLYVKSTKIDLLDLAHLCDIADLKEIGGTLRDFIYKTTGLMSLIINSGNENKVRDLAPSSADIWEVTELEKMLSETEVVNEHPKVGE